METKNPLNRDFEKSLEELSPFEIKNTLIDLAEKKAKASSSIFLNAGRGNPNWICTEPRHAFFLLGQWALNMAEKVKTDEPGVPGMPEANGLADELKAYLEDIKEQPGGKMLGDAFRLMTEKYGCDENELALEWANSIIGDLYVTPPRILKYTEVAVRSYLAQEMGRRNADEGKSYDLFATEGGTAAMCYIFQSLVANHLLKKGDHIAIMTPIFTPYIEIPDLDEYKFKVTNVTANRLDRNGMHEWQYDDAELDKLRNPAIKLVCLVNPSNPPSYTLSDHDLDRIVDIVKKDNPNLMIITDDVYGTFAKDFESLMYALPYNTLCVYSFSKYFGATGWRLAVIAAAKENVFDKLLGELSEAEKEDLAKRYRSITDDVPNYKFIDRMVADSRSVALNHTAGLSGPQQIQMSLFALMCLLDTEDKYKKLMQSMIHDRLDALWTATGFKLMRDPLRVGYYSEIDMMVWAKKLYGDDFAKWLKTSFEPLDVVMRLATRTSVVLLNGSGFDGPDWSIRASLANLDKDDYTKIGTSIKQILDEYYAMYTTKK